LSRWIVSNVPAWLLLLGLLVLVAGGAVLVEKFVRQRYPRLTEDAHNDATRFAFGVVGMVYAFFVGFVASAMWSQTNSEDEQARAEGAAAVQLARDRTAFDNVDSDRIRQALLDYERAALSEWPLAANGRAYPEADNALQRLYAAYEQVQPHSDTQKTFLARSFTNLDKVSQARTARVMQAETDVGAPWSLWAVILLASGLVVGCSVVYGVAESRMHSAVVATVSVLVAANLFLILELSDPYIGEMAASPQPLREVVAVLAQPAT
jgi:hypothetical protein